MTDAIREADHVFAAIAAELDTDPDIVLAEMADLIATPLPFGSDEVPA